MSATFSINGRVPSWTSLQVTISGKGRRVATIQDISGIQHSVPKTLVHGAGVNPIGFTRGRYMPGKPTITMLLPEADALRRDLGDGYLTTSVFDISVTYQFEGDRKRSAVLQGCGVSDEREETPAGDDPHTCVWELTPNRIILDGVQPTAPSTV